MEGIWAAPSPLLPPACVEGIRTAPGPPLPPGCVANLPSLGQTVARALPRGLTAGEGPCGLGRRAWERATERRLTRILDRSPSFQERPEIQVLRLNLLIFKIGN